MHSHRNRPSSGAIGVLHDSLVFNAKIWSSSVQYPRMTPIMVPMSLRIWWSINDWPTTVVRTNSTPSITKGSPHSKDMMYLMADASLGSTRMV